MSESTSNLTRLTECLNTNYHRWNIYNPEQNESVKSYLLKNLPAHTPNTVEELRGLGCFYINGIRSDLDQVLPTPCKLEFYEPKQAVSEFLNSYAKFNPEEHILYDQNGLVVVYKPARLHSLPAKEQNLISLWTELSKHFKSSIHIPSRLDFSTSGLILLSRTPETHAFVQNVYAQRWIEKLYLFETSNLPNWTEQRLSANLAEDPTHPILRAVVDTGGQTAITDFKLLETLDPSRILFSAKPHTGRTHQIRVHAKHLGLPITGDNFYGGAEAVELRLTAYKLSFPTPLSRSLVSVSVPSKLRSDWLNSFSIMNDSSKL